MVFLGLVLSSFVAMADDDDKYKPIEYHPDKVYSQQYVLSTESDSSDTPTNPVSQAANERTSSVQTFESSETGLWAYVALAMGVAGYFYRIQAKRGKIENVYQTKNTGVERYIKTQLVNSRMTGVDKYVQKHLANKISMTGVARYVSRLDLQNKE